MNKYLILVVVVCLVFIPVGFAESCASDKVAVIGDSIARIWAPKFKTLCDGKPVDYSAGAANIKWVAGRFDNKFSKPHKDSKYDETAPTGPILSTGISHLIVAIGKNDVIFSEKTGATVSSIKTNLAKIYQEAKKKNIKVIAGTLVPYNVKSKNSKNEMVKEINKWIKKQREEGKIDGVIDFYNLLLGTEPCIVAGYDISGERCKNVHPYNAGSAMASLAERYFSGKGNLNKKMILHIGDSHSDGAYGRELYKLMRGINPNQQVEHRSVCGSRPYYFLKGTKGHCGSLAIYKSGQKQSITKTPLISDLMRKLKPDVVIVSLAGNMYGKKDRITNTEKLVDEIVKTKTECYWVGPKYGPFKTYEQAGSLMKDIKKGINGRCKFIDSRKLAEFEWCGKLTGCPKGTGLHFDQHGPPGRKAAQKWAEGVFWNIHHNSLLNPSSGLSRGVTRSTITPNNPGNDDAKSSTISNTPNSTTTYTKVLKTHIAGCSNVAACQEVDNVWLKLAMSATELSTWINRIYDPKKGFVSFDSYYYNVVATTGGVATPGGSPRTYSGSGGGKGTYPTANTFYDPEAKITLTKGYRGVYTLAMKEGSPYLRAFIRMITFYEGGAGPCNAISPYKTLVGGRVTNDPGKRYGGKKSSGGKTCYGNYFNGYNGHPGISVHVKNYASGNPLNSNAAGRYQYIGRYWPGFAKGTPGGKNDFGPVNQDWAIYNRLKNLGVAKLLEEAGKNPNIKSDEFIKIWQKIMAPSPSYIKNLKDKSRAARLKALDGSFNGVEGGKKIGSIWASLPYGCYAGQSCDGKTSKNNKFQQTADLYVNLLKEELKLASQ